MAPKRLFEDMTNKPEGETVITMGKGLRVLIDNFITMTPSATAAVHTATGGGVFFSPIHPSLFALCNIV